MTSALTEEVLGVPGQSNWMRRCAAAKHHGRRGTIRLVSCAGTVALLAALFTGCASESTHWATGPRSIEATRAMELAYHYREQALTLSRLADAFEWEPRGEALHNVASAEDSSRRAHIQYLRIQAASAFERARVYREQIPHNQVY